MRAPWERAPLPGVEARLDAFERRLAAIEQHNRTKAAVLRDVAHAIPIVGHGNAEAAGLGDIVVVALPATGLAATLPEAREACRGKVVVSTVVPLTFGGPRLFTPPGGPALTSTRAGPTARR